MPLNLHPELIMPPDDMVLWRYMDLAKFLLLLENQTLWFSRLDQFEDPLEGTFTDAEVEHLRESERLTLLDGRPLPPTAFVDGYLRGPQLMRVTAFVSCWRAGAAESMAMWDLYGKGSGIVAIKTNVRLLRQALASSPLRIFLSKVGYIDWSEAPFDNNMLVMCFRKDSSYAHEGEVRAVVWDNDLSAEVIAEVKGVAASLKALQQIH